MRRFYTPPEHILNGEAVLGPDETRHLRDVLRLRAGDKAAVFDGEGREYSCSVAAVEKTRSILHIEKEIPPASPESPLEITVAAAILPGEKFEITVQKSVELGVNRLQPLYTRRCEVKPGGGTRNFERWKKISLESAKQSGRARLMTIGEPIHFGEFIAGASRHSLAVSRILFSERDGSSFESVQAGGAIIAVFGPKGGWDDLELKSAKDAGFSIVTFGGRIMRAETAAIALTAIIQHRFGDLR